MDDLINRQAAIKAVIALCDSCDSGHCGECRVNYPGEKDCRKVLEGLPSVQPESSEYEELDFVKEHERIPVTLTVQPETEERTAESAQNVPKDELISRKAAIDAVRDQDAIISPISDDVLLVDKAMVMTELMMLPSTQPEKQHGRIFQGIIVEYPTISTYPECEGKPYFSIKYTENGQEFIGYGTYKPEVLSEYLKEDFMPSVQPESRREWYMKGYRDAQRWIPVTERLPDVRQWVLCQCRANIMDVLRLTDDGSWYRKPNEIYMSGFVLAWMPLPEPWRGGQDETN